MRPGSWHEPALPHLYPHTAPSQPDRIPVLAHKGCIGAGIGVLTPVKRLSTVERDRPLTRADHVHVRRAGGAGGSHGLEPFSSARGAETSRMPP